MVEAVFMLIAAVAAIGLIRLYALVRLHTAELRVVYAQRFFDLAGKIADDDRVDDALLDEIRSMTERLTDSGSFWAFRDAVEAASSGQAAPTAARRAMPADLERDWGHLVQAWLIAMSCLRPLAGLAMRSKLLALANGSGDAQTSRILRWAEVRLNLRHA